MNNFGTLVLYEMKKILQNKFTLIAMVLMLFIALTDGGIFTWSKLDNEFKEAELQIDGRILDDDLLADMMANLDEYGVDSYSRENMTYAELMDLVRKLADFEKPLSAYTAEELYQARIEYNLKSMKGDRLSEDEILYWQEKEALVEKPFVWRCVTGSNYLVQGFYTEGVLCVFLAAIALSAMFSGERRNRTEPMIYVTKHGRQRIYYAKILAGCLYLLVTILFLAMVFVVTNYLKRGMNGLDAQMQIFRPRISEPMTMWQAAVIELILLIFICILLAMTAMVLSELFHNSLAVMGSMIGFFALTIVLQEQIPVRLRYLSQAFRLIPTNMLLPTSLWEYRLIGAHGHYLTAYQFTPILCLCLTVIAFVIGRFSYMKKWK